MSSMRKSTRRESRCRMARICRAPSDVVRGGGGGAAGLGGVAVLRVSPKSNSTPSESSPPKSKLKKARKAKPIFK